MKLVREIIFLFITMIITLIICTLATWWNWNNQITDVQLHDVFFDLLPDLSHIEYPITNYILIGHIIVTMMSFKYNHIIQYVAQFIFLQCILSSIRALSVSMTILPNIHVYDYCTKEVDNFFQVLAYMIRYGTCGDYMFSGHTVTAFLLYMFGHKHAINYLWEVLSGILFGAQILFLLLLRWHYSVDILIAMIITWFIFMFYKRYETLDRWFYFKEFILSETTKSASQVGSTVRARRIVF